MPNNDDDMPDFDENSITYFRHDNRDNFFPKSLRQERIKVPAMKDEMSQHLTDRDKQELYSIMLDRLNVEMRSYDLDQVQEHVFAELTPIFLFFGTKIKYSDPKGA